MMREAKSILFLLGFWRVMKEKLLSCNLCVCVRARVCLPFRWSQPFKDAAALERAHHWVNAGANLHGRSGLLCKRCRASRSDGETKQ